MNAKPMLNLDRMVIWVCYTSVVFVFGMYVGEDQAAVKLQPCPQAAKGELYKSSHGPVQTCQYVTLEKQGRKYSLKTVRM